MRTDPMPHPMSETIPNEVPARTRRTGHGVPVFASSIVTAAVTHSAVMAVHLTISPRTS